MHALPPLLAAALLAGVALAIWLLYRMRAHRPQLLVGSLVVWRRALARQRSRRARWRWLYSLMLALAIGLSLALAWLRPEPDPLRASQRRLTVILDNASSMGARTRAGATRWQRALHDARALIEAAPAGGEILVLDTAGRARSSGFVPAARALEQLDALVLSPEPSVRMPALPAGTSGAPATLFTDGVGVEAFPAGVVVRSVFEAADNVGITAFEGRPVPSDPTRYQVFLRIESAGASPMQVDLEIEGEGGFRVERRVPVAQEPANVMLDVSGYPQGPLRAAVRAPGDAFALDDTAYWVVPPHGVKRVLLVTRGNRGLADALRALPGVALSIARPADFADRPVFDAYVFDGFAPPQPPSAGALLFRPVRSTWPATRWREETAPLITGWDEAHPLAAAIAWPELRLGKALLAEPSAASVLVTAHAASRSGGLVVAGRDRARFVAVGIDLADSNLPLHPGLPVLLGTALDWLIERPLVVGAGLGRIQLPIAQAQVRDARGSAVAAHATASGILFEAARPGIFVASGAGEQRIVAANVADPRTVRINDTRLQPAGAPAALGGRPAWSWPAPWIALLGFAFVLLVLEWPAFVRRVTE